MIKCIHKRQKYHQWHAPGVEEKLWEEAASFAVNPRGILTHRVKAVESHLINGKVSHHSVDYWCGGGCCFELGSENEMLVDNPPDNRMLCVGCEAKAEAKGHGNADKLIGRHIHRGVLKAHQVCCLETTSSPIVFDESMEFKL